MSTDLSAVPVTLPRKAWALLIMLGLVVAMVFALVPVGSRFGDDPLLRLRELSPELSPPDATALCGSPVRGLSAAAKDTTLYEVARANACEEASRRRILLALASGAAIVMLGLLGMVAASPRSDGSRPT